MYHFSQFLGLPVFDRDGKKLGNLKDLIVPATRTEAIITGLVISSKSRGDFSLSWKEVEKVEKKVLILKSPEGELKKRVLEEDEILLKEHLLDKRVINTQRRKVVRVSGIELEETERGLLISRLDTGLSGVLQRLGFKRILGRKLRFLEKSVSWPYVEPLEGKLKKVYQKLIQLHPADIADIIEELEPSKRGEVLSRFDKDTAANILREIEPEVQVSLTETLKPDQMADILEKMEPDDAADLLGRLSSEKSEKLLEEMEEKAKREVEAILAHAEDSAGGIMTTEYISLSQEATADEALEHLRKLAPEREMIYYLYVTDVQGRLVGVLPLRQLVMAGPQKEFQKS